MWLVRRGLSYPPPQLQGDCVLIQAVSDFRGFKLKAGLIPFAHQTLLNYQPDKKNPLRFIFPPEIGTRDLSGVETRGRNSPAVQLKLTHEIQDISRVTGNEGSGSYFKRERG